MIRIVVLLTEHNRRYTIIRADTGETIKRSGLHRNATNCTKNMYDLVERTKATHELVKIVHV